MVNCNEIITAIILESSDNIESFNRSLRQIHKFFYDISINPKYSNLFEGLYFDTNGQYPFSETLDEILTDLQSCGIIGSSNPLLKEYTIKIKQKDLKKGIFQFYPSTESLIKEISTEFSAKLNASKNKASLTYG